MSGESLPREVHIPVWVPAAPMVALLVGSLALWGLWHSPWSPSRLGNQLELLRQDNLRLESQRDRAEQGLSQAEGALKGIEALIQEGPPPRTTRPEDSAEATVTKGVLGFFGGADRVAPDVARLLEDSRRIRGDWEHLLLALERRPDVTARLPTIRPVRADAPEVSPFGPAQDPFTGLHMDATGVAWGVPVGTPVWATGAGRVVAVDRQMRWGQIVEIDHGRDIRTFYGHLSQVSVREGDLVLRGQVIGLSGRSGATLGPRLFYAIFQGREVRNPWDFILPDPPRDSLREDDGFLRKEWKTVSASKESEGAGQDQSDASGFGEGKKSPSRKRAQAREPDPAKQDNPPTGPATGTRPEKIDRLEGKSSQPQQDGGAARDPKTGSPAKGRVEPTRPGEGEASQNLQPEKVETTQGPEHGDKGSTGSSATTTTIEGDAGAKRPPAPAAEPPTPAPPAPKPSTPIPEPPPQAEPPPSAAP